MASTGSVQRTGTISKRVTAESWTTQSFETHRQPFAIRWLPSMHAFLIWMSVRDHDRLPTSTTCRGVVCVLRVYAFRRLIARVEANVGMAGASTEEQVHARQPPPLWQNLKSLFEFVLSRSSSRFKNMYSAVLSEQRHEPAVHSA